MAMQQQGTVVGVFRDDDDAREAIRALKDAGFTEEQIGVARSRGDQTDRTGDGDTTDEGESYAGEGAMAGVAAGAGIGALWGLGILAGILPAIGPAIAGGTLAIILSSAAAGAATAGLAGALIGMGLTKEEAEFYESEMRAGRTIVTVNAGARQGEAMALLRSHGAYDMSTRHSMEDETEGGEFLEDETRSSVAGTAGQFRSSEKGFAESGAGQSFQTLEERLDIHKTPVQTGEVGIRKEVETEHKTIEVPVSREEVVIERRPGSGQEVSADKLQPGQEIRIPVTEEQVDVTKHAVVAEEVNVGKRKVQDEEKVDKTLRKEKIKVEKKGDVDVREEPDTH